MGSGLLEHYLATRDADAPAATADAEALLVALCRAAGERWPGVDVDPASLAQALGALPTALSALAQETVDEVGLALGCADGSEAALSALETSYLDTIEPALGHMRLGRAMVDEVTQEVRRKLLVSEDGPARIVDYAGRGSLRGLVKVMATRTAISMLRKTKRETSLPANYEKPGGDPELSFLKERYRAPFSDAFEAAISELDHHERNLLRMHFLGKVTLDRLAKMYGVHRATIVRRLAAIRERLAKATREGLGERLAIRPDELDSIMGLIRSRMDVSVERMLRTRDSHDASDAPDDP